MSDERKDYGPTGCFNRSFSALLLAAVLVVALALLGRWPR